MEKRPMDRSTTTTRWRGLKTSTNSTFTENAAGRPVIRERESDLTPDDVDISLIQTRTYLLSAGIGDTNKQYNKYKGKIGLVIWCINIAIHFSLDFYEAWTIFGNAWATCIGLFLFTLVVCCMSMIRHSIPWFLRGVKKLKKDGNYPKTLSRVRLMIRFMPFLTVAFAIGAAAGQFGCYAADDALRVNFNRNNSLPVPQAVETFINVLRATSLIHIFYGFCSLLLFHLTLVFMIQSSMKEYNERMGKLFREVPINLEFSEAVNLFSARAKFVRDGSQKSSIVLTTLLVACCTSFVLNAYNFLFFKKHAIYIWFALAPLIWAVTPLMGAAWITRTYWQYKLVVVNAWVDIPDEHELEARAHSALHQSHADDITAKASGKWEALADKVGKNSNIEERKGIKLLGSEKVEISSETKVDIVNGLKANAGDSLPRRKSEIILSRSPKSDNNKRSSLSVKLRRNPAPTIMFSDYDGEDDNSSRKWLHRWSRKISDSSLSDVPERSSNSNPEQGLAVEINQNQNTLSKTVSKGRVEIDTDKPKEVCIDMDVLEDQHDQDQHNSSRTTSTSSMEEPFNGTQESNVKDALKEGRQSGWGRLLSTKAASSLKIPDTSQAGNTTSEIKTANFLSGISKTYHKWRTKTKKKKKFHYEKYIIYLESILPTVGFSIGGVIIDWNGIYTFIVIMTFMVGVFAQEAFFGT